MDKKQDIELEEQERLFSKKTRNTLIGISTMLILLSLVLSMYGHKVSGPSARQLDSYSRQEVGHQAFFLLMKAMGYRPFRQRTTWGLERVSKPMFFIEPHKKMTYKGKKYTLKETLASRMKSGFHSVIVLPKWKIKTVLGSGGKKRKTISQKQSATLSFIRSQLPDFTFPRLRSIADPIAISEKGGWHEMKASFDQGDGSNEEIKLKMYHPQVFDLSGFSGDGGVVLKMGEHGLILKYQKGRGSVWIVSDPDLLHNFNLHRAENASVWYYLQEYHLKSSTMVIDEVFHGHIHLLSLPKLMGSFPNVLFVIQASLLLLLFSWAGSKRFGLAKQLKPRLGRGPKEVVEITAWVLASGQKPNRLAANYTIRLLQDLADQLNISEQLELAKRIEKVDEVAKRRNHTEEGVSILAKARSIRSKKRGAVRESLRLVRSAWNFRNSLLQHKK